MPASPSHFEILRELGRGGMGVVHLARDSSLDRLVALKGLPADFAAEPDRLARFQREAKVLASLNHPNIASIYGLESSAQPPYLILEYVEGETLAHILRSGRMPIPEALPLAIQIAEALEAAHEKGIIHRDLKPANIMVSNDGRVKVLDFGLARGSDSPQAPTGSTFAPISRTTPAPPASPTIQGAIMGTAGYMSPEQARGKRLDKRSDIFSFGCVLFEVLSGRLPFPGETDTDSLGAILHREPDWSLLPIETPSRVRDLLINCLTKDCKHRLHDIADARIAMQQAMTLREPGKGLRKGGRAAWPWAVAAAICGGLAVTGWFFHPAPAPAATPITRSAIAMPGRIASAADGPLALSPDGRTIVFAAGPPGEPPQLWTRALDSLVAQPLSGTEGAIYPFWSADSRDIGFFSKGKLRRVPITGGSIITLADADDGRGGAWSTDGVIIFAPQPFGPLMRVPASGGTPAAVTTVTGPGASHRLPSFLPDGKHFLYTAREGGSISADTSIIIADLSSQVGTPLLKSLSQGVFVPPASVVFVRNSNLMTQRIDIAAKTLSGEPKLLAEHVDAWAQRAVATFSASAQGAVVYRPAPSLQQLQWLDGDGHAGPKLGEPASFLSLSLSLDAAQALATIQRADGQYDIWLCDTRRGTRTRQVEDVSNSGALWSPAGGRFAYWDRQNACHLRETGAAPKDTIIGSGIPCSWSKDGDLLLTLRQDPKTSWDIYIQRATGGDARPYLNSPAVENAGSFSPDATWIAFAASPLSRTELMVAPISDASAAQQVTSTGIGEFVSWLDNGRIVYTDTSNQRLFSVTAAISPTGVEVGEPVPVFVGAEIGSTPFAITRDGKRLLVASPVSGDRTDSLILLQNVVNATPPRR